MIVEAGHETSAAASLDALGSALRRLAEGATLDDVLRALVEAVAASTRTEVVVLRALDESEISFRARAVAASSTAVAAELEGSRLPAAKPAADAVGALAEQLGLAGSLAVPILVGDRTIGRLELFAKARSLGPEDGRSPAWPRTMQPSFSPASEMGAVPTR